MAKNRKKERKEGKKEKRKKERKKVKFYSVSGSHWSSGKANEKVWMNFFALILNKLNLRPVL